MYAEVSSNCFDRLLTDNMLKKFLVVFLMFMYLYTLTFNMFMTSVFRLPTPLLFCIPLLFVAGRKSTAFAYKRELIAFFITLVAFYLISQYRIKEFNVNLITIVCCCLYFNYYIGEDLERLKISVFVFFGLLGISACVMMLNHANSSGINGLRAVLTGGIIEQYPSGIAIYMFTFGYQLAAFTTFLVIYTSVYKRGLMIQAASLVICLVFLLYGMNRSSFIAFVCALLLFWLLFYRIKVVFILALIAGLSFMFNSAIEDLSSGRKQNILSKNERKGDENRGDLMIENVKIIGDYPEGLVFHGKTWVDVAMHNATFRSGAEGLITSHNAYLMFVTYLGIVVAPLLLLFLYYRVLKISWYCLTHIRSKNNRLLICLCFSFMAISINAMFHNEWLLSSGPTLFLYFSILQLGFISRKEAQQLAAVG